MGTLGPRSIQVGLTLGAIVGLVGCGDQSEDIAPTIDLGFSSFNGMSAVNGLSSFNGMTGVNGLSSFNGLSAMNGLSSFNGLSAMNGLMTTDGGRKTVAYLVKCALASNDSLTKQDQNGASYTFPGGLGLCPAWKNGGIANDSACQEYLSACMMAHINTAGIHIPIWLDADAPTIGWGIDTANYPRQEGSFFGNIMMTGSLASIGMPTVTAPVAYYCDGDGFTQGPNGDVAGRIGAGQGSNPFVNPYASAATGPLCKNSAGMVAQYSNGIAQGNPDGYKKLDANGTPWNRVITVWRNTYYTPVFDAAFDYTVSALVTRDNPMAVDVDASSVAQQWNKSAGLSSSKFDFVSAGGLNFKIVMKTNANKCMDAGSCAQNGAVTVKDCNGSSAQIWSVNPMPAKYGTFWIKNGSRCLSVPGNSTAQRAAGTDLQVQDCVSTNSGQQMRIEAVALQ